MSAVPGATASSWTPSRIQSTSVTRNCSNGAAATSTRNSSMSTNSIAGSPRSRPARAPPASPPPAELAGGPPRTHAFHEHIFDQQRVADSNDSGGNICVFSEAGGIGGAGLGNDKIFEKHPTEDGKATQA